MRITVADLGWHEQLRREFERLQFAREQFIDAIDHFPPNPRTDAKLKRMERHMKRIKMTLHKHP